MLPTWMDQLNRTLPDWLSQVAHLEGPGRYRFALDAYEPYDLDSSAMALNIVQTTGARRPDEADRQAWSDYLTSLQRESDGLMIDAGMERHIIAKEADKPTDTELANVRRWTTRNGLITVLGLGGRPRYPLRHD